MSTFKNILKARQVTFPEIYTKAAKNESILASKISVFDYLASSQYQTVLNGEVELVNAHFETTRVSFGTRGVKFCILIKLAIQISSFFDPYLTRENQNLF